MGCTHSGGCGRSAFAPHSRLLSEDHSGYPGRPTLLGAVSKRQEVNADVDMACRGGSGSGIGKAPQALGKCLSLPKQLRGKGSLEGAVSVARLRIKFCGMQSSSHHRAAATVYESECREFARRHPKVAAAYARLAGELHDADRLAAGAFLVGFSLGVADVNIDPVAVCKKMKGEDWPALEQAISNFVNHPAVVQCNGTFEPDNPESMQEMATDFPSVQARSEAFLHGALQPLAEALTRPLKDLRRVGSEAHAPVSLAVLLQDICCADWSAGAERRVCDAFRIAEKAERKADLAALHFVLAAWRRQPRGAVQWHHVGQNLGIVCLALIGAC
mmetsp:Transcript_90676/g.292663  ORF Transcript_90676/g.292663 Transcript_90676/m.292663 type:complete len:330 (+) Transcript_90676:60-1049(+)